MKSAGFKTPQQAEAQLRRSAQRELRELGSPQRTKRARRRR